MAAIVCDICDGSLSMDTSGDYALCDSCGMKHTKDRLKIKAQGIAGAVNVNNQTNNIEKNLKDSKSISV